MTGIKLTFEYELGTTKVIRYVVTFRNDNMLTLDNNFLIKILVSNSLMNECSCQQTVGEGKETRDFHTLARGQRSQIRSSTTQFASVKSTRILIWYIIIIIIICSIYIAPIHECVNGASQWIERTAI